MQNFGGKQGVLWAIQTFFSLEYIHLRWKLTRKYTSSVLLFCGHGETGNYETGNLCV